MPLNWHSKVRVKKYGRGFEAKKCKIEWNYLPQRNLSCQDSFSAHLTVSWTPPVSIDSFKLSFKNDSETFLQTSKKKQDNGFTRLLIKQTLKFRELTIDYWNQHNILMLYVLRFINFLLNIKIVLGCFVKFFIRNIN